MRHPDQVSGAEVWDVEVGVGLAGHLTDVEALDLVKQMLDHYGHDTANNYCVIFENGTVECGEELREKVNVRSGA